MIDPDHTRAYFNVLRGPSKMSTAGLNPSLQSTRFPPAAVLVVKPIRDGFLLIRLTDDGSFAGDTWSADWGEVREEVAENYADVIGEWCDIPEGTEDVESYVNRVRSVEEGPLHDRDRRRGRTPCFSVEHIRILDRDENSLIVRIPGSGNKQDLLSNLADVLRFPGWFGLNWDALYDCLRDLNWIAQRRIVLIHPVLSSRMPAADMRSYLDVLRDAIDDWVTRGGDHELVAAFHPEDFAIVEEMSFRRDDPREL